MKRPLKYTIICNKTNDIKMTNIEPRTHDLETWESTEEVNVKVLKQTKTAFIDKRYDAKLRLYNYVTFKKNNKEVPKYQPFKGSEIGKSKPILNF